jgi:hypothetical protein
VLPEGEETNDGRDCRVDAVDDRDNARLEAAEALELEREGDDQADDCDHEPDGERSQVDRAGMPGSEREREQRCDRECEREPVDTARSAADTSPCVSDADLGASCGDREQDTGERSGSIDAAQGHNSGSGEQRPDNVTASTRPHKRHQEWRDERERDGDSHRDQADRPRRNVRLSAASEQP